MQRVFQIYLQLQLMAITWYMLAEIVGSSFYCSWEIRVNHEAEHHCCVAILNPFQESYLLAFGERIISFERAATNHGKVASPKQRDVNLYCT